MLSKKEAEVILKYVGASVNPDVHVLTEEEFKEAPKLLTKIGASQIDKYFMIMDIAQSNATWNDKIQKVIDLLGGSDMGGPGHGVYPSGYTAIPTGYFENKLIPSDTSGNKRGISDTQENKLGIKSISESKEIPQGYLKKEEIPKRYSEDVSISLNTLGKLVREEAFIDKISRVMPHRTYSRKVRYYMLILGSLAECDNVQNIYDFKKAIGERFGWSETTISQRINELKAMDWLVIADDEIRINVRRVKDILEEAGVLDYLEKASRMDTQTQYQDIILTGQDPKLVGAIKRHIDPIAYIFTFDFGEIDPTDEAEVYLAETLRDKPEAIIWAIHNVWAELVERIKDPFVREKAKHSLRNLRFEIRGLWGDRTNMIDPDLDGKLIAIEGFLEGAINQGSVVQSFTYAECYGGEERSACGYKTMFYLAPSPKTPESAKCPVCGGNMRIYTHQYRTMLLFNKHPESKPTFREIEELKSEIEVIKAYVRLADDDRDILVVIPRSLWNELRHMPSYVRLAGILRYDRLGLIAKRDITPYVEVMSIEETTPRANITEDEFQEHIRSMGYKDAMDYFLNRYLVDYKSIHGDPGFTEAIKKLALAIATHLAWERGEDGTSYKVETIGCILIGPQGCGKSTIINKVVGLFGANLDPYVSPADSEKNLVVIENAISKDVHLPLKGKLPRNDLGLVVFEELDATIKNSEKLAIIKDALERGIVIRAIRGINYTFPARVSRVAIMNPPKDLEGKFYDTMLKTVNSEDMAQLLVDIISRIGQSNVDRFPLIYLFPPMDANATETLLEALVSGQMNEKGKITDEELEKARRFTQLIRYRDAPFNPKDTPDAWRVFVEQFKTVKPVIRRFGVSEPRFGKTIIAMIKAIAKLHHHRKVEPADVLEAFGVIRHSFIFRFDERTWEAFERIREKYLSGKVINDATYIVLSEYQEKGITEPIDKRALVKRVQEVLKEKENREFSQEEITQHIEQMKANGILYEPIPGKVRLVDNVA